MHVQTEDNRPFSRVGRGLGTRLSHIKCHAINGNRIHTKLKYLILNIRQGLAIINFIIVLIFRMVERLRADYD